MPQSTGSFLPRRMRRGVLGVLVLTVALATLAVFAVSQRYFERDETQTAANRSVLYLRSVNEMFRQHQHLPFVIASDPRNFLALSKPDEEPFTSARLKKIAQQAKLEAIYLMDARGLVVATSNAGEAHSFLGQNYGFRPYFQNALERQRSDYFAIGATSRRPGYFVAEPVPAPNPDCHSVVWQRHRHACGFCHLSAITQQLCFLCADGRKANNACGFAMLYRKPQRF